MREFLNMTKEEWQDKYEFLGFVEYCPECGKAADHTHKWEDGTTKDCFCDDCKINWAHRYGIVFI